MYTLNHLERRSDFHQFRAYNKIFNENVIKCYLTTSGTLKGVYASFLFSACVYTSRKRLGTADLEESDPYKNKKLSSKIAHVKNLALI